MENALIIFAKNPVYGKVKTRLATEVGNDKALEVYNELLKHTRDVAAQVTARRFVFYADKVEVGDLWESGFDKKIQSHGILGERMTKAFAEVSNEGFEKKIIIGTDCFEITADIINDGFDQLDDNDIVLGPATDGGYYLLGMKKSIDEIFVDIPWSTEHVLGRTLEICKGLSLSVYRLPMLSDIDTKADLDAYTFNQRAGT